MLVHLLHLTDSTLHSGEDVRAFVRLPCFALLPELTRRGRYKKAYNKGTLREKLFGPGRARLKAPHPATQYRRQTVKAAE